MMESKEETVNIEINGTREENRLQIDYFVILPFAALLGITM